MSDRQVFVETVKTLVRLGETCFKRPEHSEPRPIFLKKSSFSKEEVKLIRKQMKKELGIRMKFGGYPGRPRAGEDYKKYHSITW